LEQKNKTTEKTTQQISAWPFSCSGSIASFEKTEFQIALQVIETMVHIMIAPLFF
jgi:hypothetical protein